MKLSALKRRNIPETIAWTIATWFGSGCSPKAPGTVGSFCSLPLVLVGYFYGGMTLMELAAVLFLIGWWATAVVLRSQQSLDPGFVVIDETIGQTLAFALITPESLSWPIVAAGFLLFRFFDIIKLWPASYFDKFVHNAFGVMMDDVIAGLYAALVLYGLTFLF